MSTTGEHDYVYDVVFMSALTPGNYETHTFSNRSEALDDFTRRTNTTDLEVTLYEREVGSTTRKVLRHHVNTKEGT